jgi:hypothetical protein
MYGVHTGYLIDNDAHYQVFNPGAMLWLIASALAGAAVLEGGRGSFWSAYDFMQANAPKDN